MEQQVWSVQLAKQSILRPRVAVPFEEGHAQGLGLFPRAPRVHHGGLQCAGPVALPRALRVWLRAPLDS
jgi:hypothetical protein